MEEEKKQNINLKRPTKIKLTKEEILKRMADFPKRKDKIIAALRQNKD